MDHIYFDFQRIFSFESHLSQNEKPRGQGRANQIRRRRYNEVGSRGHIATALRDLHSDQLSLSLFSLAASPSSSPCCHRTSTATPPWRAAARASPPPAAAGESPSPAAGAEAASAAAPLEEHD